jgi:hypothetical protein
MTMRKKLTKTRSRRLLKPVGSAKTAFVLTRYQEPEGIAIDEASAIRWANATMGGDWYLLPLITLPNVCLARRLPQNGQPVGIR